MSFQTDIDSLIGGVSVFNLALNVAGIINNKKNVAIYVIEENEENSATKQIKKTNILEGSLGRLGGMTNLASKIDGSGFMMSADIVEQSKLTEHPLEDGKIVADNKVKMPTEITVRITLQSTDYKDKLNMLKKYKDDNQMLYVETKFGGYMNMQIVSMPCNLNATNVSRLTFDVRLREVLVLQDMEKQTANENDANTIDTGTMTGITQNLDSVVFE